MGGKSGTPTAGAIPQLGIEGIRCLAYNCAPHEAIFCERVHTIGCNECPYVYLAAIDVDVKKLPGTAVQVTLAIPKITGTWCNAGDCWPWDNHDCTRRLLEGCDGCAEAERKVVIDGGGPELDLSKEQPQ